MNSGTIWGRLVEKPRGKKSRATVPLRQDPDQVLPQRLDPVQHGPICYSGQLQSFYHRRGGWIYLGAAAKRSRQIS